MKKKRILRILLGVVALCAVAAGLFYHQYVRPNGYHFPDFAEMEAPRSELTAADYIEDFEVAYRTLEQYYPFFGVNRLKHGIDWPAEKERHLEKIRACESDREFALAMAEILSGLHNGHTHMVGPDWGAHMYFVYKTINAPGAWRMQMAEAYENPQSVERYGLTNSLLEEMAELDRKRSEQPETVDTDNVIAEDLIEDQVGYIRIRSLPVTHAPDEAVIRPYLERVRDFPVLILDIRGNSGGSDTYWSEFLLPAIIDRPYEMKTYYAVKEGELFRKMLRQQGMQEIRRDDPDYEALPEVTKELLAPFSHWAKWPLRVEPAADSIRYAGRLYLLVDEGVYSSSEMLAVFAKETGLATLVGTRTGGDGIGYDPMQIALPNTGYVLRFPTGLGITESGSVNELEQTVPDIDIENRVDVRRPLDRQLAIRAILEREGIYE